MSKQSPGDIRVAIGQYAERHAEPSKMDVINAVAEEFDVGTDTVMDELEALENNGFVYLVNGTVKVA